MTLILSFPEHATREKTASEDQSIADFEEFIAHWKPTAMPTDTEVSRVRSLFIEELKRLGVEPFEESDEEIRRGLVRSQAYEAWERELERRQSRKLLQFPSSAHR
jgi:hypothetical protein